MGLRCQIIFVERQFWKIYELRTEGTGEKDYADLIYWNERQFWKGSREQRPLYISLIHTKDFPEQYESYFSNESGSTEKIPANQAINHAWSFTSFRKRIQIFRGKTSDAKEK